MRDILVAAVCGDCVRLHSLEMLEEALSIQLRAFSADFLFCYGGFHSFVVVATKNNKKSRPKMPTIERSMLSPAFLRYIT